MIFCSLSSRSGPIRLACTVRCASLIATRLYSIWTEGGRREREGGREGGEKGRREREGGEKGRREGGRGNGEGARWRGGFSDICCCTR